MKANLERFNFKLILVCICLLSLTSCATIMCTQAEVPALTINSTPSGAEVYLNGRFVGNTPYSHFGTEADVKKITVKKAGYESQSLKPRKLNGWAYVNFLPWPMYNFIWGYFVDRAQAKCWSYTQDVFYFNLKKFNL